MSSHLHLWIDLIFGHKQKGPAAVESMNTFHPYFYAQRDRQNPIDPSIKNIMLGYVSNFGQIPKQVKSKKRRATSHSWGNGISESYRSHPQLFTKPHPPRSGSKKDVPPPSHPTPFFFKLDSLKTTAQPFKGKLC